MTCLLALHRMFITPVSPALLILLYGKDMTDGCISPGNRGFKEIREWIDDDGREVRSEVKDVGEILNRAEKLADKKGGKKGESKWKPENGNGDTVEPIKEESVAASPSGETRKEIHETTVLWLLDEG